MNLLINNELQEILNYLVFQFREDELKIRNKYEFKVYFDSYDVICIIQGVKAFEYAQNFRINRFNESESLLVHGFAYEGLLGPIHLLPPHRDELAEKLNSESLFPRRFDKYNELIDDFLKLLDINLVQINFSEQNLKSLVKDQKLDAVKIFKANFLLKKIRWIERLKYLHENNNIAIDTDDYRFDEILNDSLYKKIKNALDIVRPPQRYIKNNTIDSIALYILQKELEDSMEYSKPIPLFYSSSKGIVKTARMLRNENSNLFSYRTKESNISIPVIRDSAYQIIDIVFNNNELFLKPIIESINAIAPEIKKIIEAPLNNTELVKFDLQKNIQELEKYIKDLIDIKILKEIWADLNGYRVLVDRLKELVKFQEEQRNQIGIFIGHEYDQLISEIKIIVPQSIYRFELLKDFSRIEDDLKLAFSSQPVYVDVYRDFGLLRFGLSKDKHPDIQTLIDEIWKALKEEDEVQDGINHNISRLIVYLSENRQNSVFENDLLNAIAVLWVISKYHTIDLVCRFNSNKYPHNYPNYHIALIHAAALSMIGVPKIKQAEELVGRIEKELPGTYIVWTCLGVIKFRIWQVKSKYNQIPELLSPQLWDNIQKSPDYKLAEQAISHAKNAEHYLENIINEDDEKMTRRSLMHSYVLNNYIYYVTKSGNRNEFDNIEGICRKFQDNKVDMQQWQGRFDDTLGWYFLRKAIISDDNRTSRIEYLKLAQEYHESAMSQPKTRRDEDSYKRLRDILVYVRATYSNKVDNIGPNANY